MRPALGCRVCSEWAFCLTSPLLPPVMEKVLSEGRYCPACRLAFSLLGLGWKEVAEADVPTWNAPSMVCMFLLFCFFPLLMGGGEREMFSGPAFWGRNPVDFKTQTHTAACI